MLKALPLFYIYTFLVLGIGLIGLSLNTNMASSWPGVYLLAFCLFFAYYAIEYKNQYTRLGWGLIAALFATAIGLHAFGSPSWKMVSLQLSSLSPAYSVYYNFDKLVIALIILSLWDGMKGVKWKDRQAVPVFILGCFLTAAVGMWINYIAFDPKIVPADFFAIWAFKNLFLVVLPEELFFRGFIQLELGKSNALRGWAIASLLFGIAHMGGGPYYVLLCTVAGFMYGWLYLRTGNLLFPILAHFALNTIHLIFFTYPYLAIN